MNTEPRWRVCYRTLPLLVALVWSIVSASVSQAQGVRGYRVGDTYVNVQEVFCRHEEEALALLDPYALDEELGEVFTSLFVLINVCTIGNENIRIEALVRAAPLARSRHLLYVVRVSLSGEAGSRTFLLTRVPVAEGEAI